MSIQYQERDRYLSAEEALDYGIIDEVIQPRDETSNVQKLSK